MMIKRHFFKEASARLVVCVLMVIGVCAQMLADVNPSGKDSCARYELLTNHIYDFGDVDINCDSISAEFLIKSIGNVPMIILDGDTSCKCTSVSYSHDIIQPGDTLVVKVIYHPFVLGTFRQSAVLSTNTEPYSYFRLYVKGNVVDAIHTNGELQSSNE